MESLPKRAGRWCTVLGIGGYLLGFGSLFFPLLLALIQQTSIGKVSSHLANEEVQKLCMDILWWDKIHLADLGMNLARALAKFEVEFLGISPTLSVDFPVIVFGMILCIFIGALTGAITSCACFVIRRMRHPQHDSEDAS